MRRFDHRVLDAIIRLGGHTYAVPIQEKLDAGRWYSERPFWHMVFGVSLRRIYAALGRLERDGKLTSQDGTVYYPERGNRRRRYYTVREGAL